LREQDEDPEFIPYDPSHAWIVRMEGMLMEGMKGYEEACAAFEWLQGKMIESEDDLAA
jgi:hypothetical protein